MKDAMPGTSTSKGWHPIGMLLPPNEIYGENHCPAELKNSKTNYVPLSPRFFSVALVFGDMALMVQQSFLSFLVSQTRPIAGPIL